MDKYFDKQNIQSFSYITAKFKIKYIFKIVAFLNNGQYVRMSVTDSDYFGGIYLISKTKKTN